MKIAETTISAINDRLKDVLISYVHFGTGRQQYARCPLPTHAERTASFSYDKHRNIWKCFGCGAGGDAIKFIQLMHPEKSFVQVVNTAAEILELEVQYEDGKGSYVKPPKKEYVQPPYDVLDASILKAKVVATKSRDLTANPLLASLVDLFGADVVRTVIERYAITFKSEWIEFPQIDEERKYRTGKYIKYLPNGHRCKETNPRWAHSGITDNFCQCLTGLHILKFFPGKQIAIVEGSSTMLFMACLSLAAERDDIKQLHIFTNYIWLSTGGIGGVNLGNNDIAKVLSGRRIILYPDTGAYDPWLKYEKALKSRGIEAATSYMLEKAFSAGKVGRNSDLRDFFSANADSIKSLLLYYPPEWDQPAPVDNWQLQNMACNLEWHFQKHELESCISLGNQYDQKRLEAGVNLDVYRSAMEKHAPELFKYITTE